MILGVIADDFTGASDIGNTLAKQGMKTVQYSGMPSGTVDSDIEAGVISLKSRTIPVDDAIAQTLKALEWLKEQGCKQFFFKYCSTFDSTPEGNIGQVIDALIETLNTDQVIVCPAFPGTGRSLYQGHLFVNDVLLNESGMQHHPLTPMYDSDIRRFLKKQTKNNVGHISAHTVFEGSSSIKAALDEEFKSGNKLVVIDAIRDIDLMNIGAAAEDFVLITGGSGVAMGLPENFKRNGLINETKSQWTGEQGICVALSGSCSTATRGQIKAHIQNHPHMEITVEDVINEVVTPKIVLTWALGQSGTPIIYSSADPKTVEAVQKEYGADLAAESLENFFAQLAKLLVDSGVKRLLTAGGETSGAVVKGLGLKKLEIGPEIDPGVPALRAGDNLVVALKSGNFGSMDYFEKAANILAGKGQ